MFTKKCNKNNQNFLRKFNGTGEVTFTSGTYVYTEKKIF